MRPFALLLAILLPLSASSIPETNYKELYEKEVWPYYQTGESITFAASDGVKLHYRRFLQGNKKAILIMAGRTEPTSKYAEVVYDLKDLGYDFYLLDTRGQGHSEHLIPKDTGKHYIKNDNQWITDLEQLYKEDIQKRGYDELVFLGHSMGAGIALRYAELHPDVFSKMILSSPMLEINFGDKSERSVKLLLGVLRLFGRGKTYIPGGKPGTEPYLFKGNQVTHSEVRFQMARDIEAADSSLPMGSATVKFALEAIQLTRKTFRDREKLPAIPLLLFQAEEEDFSRFERQNILCKEHPSCTKIFYKGAKHEMFQETDSIRDPLMAEVRRLLGS